MYIFTANRKDSNNRPTSGITIFENPPKFIRPHQNGRYRNFRNDGTGEWADLPGGVPWQRFQGRISARIRTRRKGRSGLAGPLPLIVSRTQFEKKSHPLF
jgi:hypothetical protein